MTIEQHFAAVRKDRAKGMKPLVEAMQTDAGFAKEVNQRLAYYRAMEGVGRLGGCWICTKINEMLTAALAVIEMQPGVPAGE